MNLIDTAHPDRPLIEQFIADRYRRRYGAEVMDFHELLIGKRDAEGHYIAALGMTPLALRPGFLEQYLDGPVEEAVAQRLQATGRPTSVLRWDMVELGNLAATQVGAARELICRMREYLAHRHFRWVVLTATRDLANSFRRLGYEPEILSRAEPARLTQSVSRWGSYYQSQPQVVFFDIEASYVTH